MHNGFQLVKRRKKNKKQNFNFGIPLHLKLQRAVEEFEASQFWYETLQIIENCLQSRELKAVTEIVSYGIGNFSESRCSLHQLAALCVLQKKYKSSVNIYDPVFSLPEINLLRELKFTVLTENEEGKRRVSDQQVTLVFLPHCPKQLTNNFLWKNWNVALCNCVLIANSFSKIIQDNTAKVLQESAAYILKISAKTVEVPLEDTYHIDNTFNDISVHHFNCEESFFLCTLEGEPHYSGDIELVTKNSVQNGWTKDNLLLTNYVLEQSRRYQITDEQHCKAREEMKFLAETYFCYLKSQRRFEEIHTKYKGKGERSIKETAEIVGFKLPHDNGK